MCVGEERRGGAFYKSPPMSGSVLALCSAARLPPAQVPGLIYPQELTFVIRI